ncbi:MAG TPA: pentapeptide repeat-containing protein [Polyangia bacterium]|nr:pentapeptide repeat-containing protein [Polyangia bacterium]
MASPQPPSPTAEDLRRDESFDDLTFAGLDLARADLGGKVFSNCTFRNLKLAESRWERARLEDCVLDDCDLTRAAPAGLVLRGVRFQRCKMMGIDWSALGAFPDLTFADCNLDYCSFIALAARKLAVTRCSFVEATFADCNVGEARFEECHFAGARFERCDLRKATFPRARDLLLDPAANQIKGAAIPPESAFLLAASFGFKLADD